MADTKISALTALTGANVDTAADVLAIVDTSVTTTKKILIDELRIALGIATQAQQETGTSNVVFVTPGRQAYNASAAKAWAFFALDGSLNASYGVTSVTDSGAGDWTVNLSVTFSSSSHCDMAVGYTGDATSGGLMSIGAHAATTVRISNYNTSGSLSDGNLTGVMFAAFGDLA